MPDTRPVSPPPDTLQHQLSAAASHLPDGHYGEWSDGQRLRAHWHQFAALEGDASPADMARKAADAARQIRDNGISYNIYAEQNGGTRPWSLDSLPFILSPAEWRQIEQGVTQRAQLLNSILADAYGPRQLLQQGLLPGALVLGHPGFLRQLDGYTPPGGIYLHIAAFDLARTPDGQWRVISQRTQAPSGLGYLLENRLIVSRLFPQAFRHMPVQHLASSYRQLLNTIHRLSPFGRRGDGTPRVVLLTPGPHNETYFEHTYLARYLGIPLVNGNDLTVRGNEVFLKTLRGLEPVQAILRRLDDDFCDPLELRPDSTLGVPGLLQAVRAGKVLMANALGSSFLESPGLHAFLPAICQHLTGQPLQLASLPSWWCGEPAARDEAVQHLRRRVIKPTYPSLSGYPHFEPVLCPQLSDAELDDWLQQLQGRAEAYTLQENLPLSQAPIWHNGHVEPRAMMLRVFAIANGQGQWNVLPGGLTRIAARSHEQIVSMQRGGSSLDTWILTDGDIDTFSMLPRRLHPAELGGKRRLITSHAAENLFWMGRYAERAENQLRLSQLVLKWLEVNDGNKDPAFIRLLVQLCQQQNLLPETDDAAAPSRLEGGELTRAILQGVSGCAGSSGGLAHHLAALAQAATPIRDRLSLSHSQLIQSASQRFTPAIRQRVQQGQYRIGEARRELSQLAVELTAIRGEQADHMTRDDGWQLLSLGRQLERLHTLASTLGLFFAETGDLTAAAFDLLLAFFDSTLTYRSYYQRRQDVLALLDLLVCDRANPRSLTSVLQRLQQALQALPGPHPEVQPPLPAELPELEIMCQRDDNGQRPALLQLTTALETAALQLSDEIGLRYFNPTQDYTQPLSSWLQGKR